MREQLAYQAAKIMAEGDISDFAFAKRKAARQLGAEDTRHMPSNQEIEAALASYRALYEHDSHPPVLRQLREESLEVMRRLEAFHPYLTGSVLSGTAGEYSDINLELYSDDPKAVLLFLIRNDIEFVDGAWDMRIAGHAVTVPSYTFETSSGAVIHAVVLPENARYSGSRKPGTHADIAGLEALLQAGEA